MTGLASTSAAFVASCEPGTPLPLFVFVETDDLALENSAEAEWFGVLARWDWKNYRPLGARYYEALYRYNQEAAAKVRTAEAAAEARGESKEQAQLRLLFDRPTAGNPDTPILFEPATPPSPVHVDPDAIAPGQTPLRLAGKQPKCFFSLFKAFLGVTIMGRPAEPEEVHRELTNNPSFARACGFTAADPRIGYRRTDVPSLRKLEQFDQIMTDSGLWAAAKLQAVRRNLDLGVIEPEPEVVHDTTHYHAYSAFEVVEHTDDNGKTTRKSQSKAAKFCGCQDKETCPHPWAPADSGAGTVVKSAGRMHWAHKASIIVLPRQGVPLDAYAVTDAATHDGRTLLPSLGQLHADFPELCRSLKYVLDDSAAYDQQLIETVRKEFGLTLRASINPRGRKPLTDDLPRGMAALTPYGELLCIGGRTMDYRGMRLDAERYLYGPPLAEDGAAYCLSCPHKLDCCPHALHGRQAAIPFDHLPHVRPDDPPMAKRFKAMMTRRPSVERVIKRMKCDLGDRRLSKRGNPAFQARLDKTLIALHILLRQ